MGVGRSILISIISIPNLVLVLDRYKPDEINSSSTLNTLLNTL